MSNQGSVYFDRASQLSKIKARERTSQSKGEKNMSKKGGNHGNDREKSFSKRAKQRQPSTSSNESTSPGSASETDDDQIISKEERLGHGEQNTEKLKTKDQLAEQLREEMSHIPLCELREMQEKMGLKAFNRMRKGLQRGSSLKSKTFKRANKNRPTELSARKPVSKQISVPKDKSKKIRDPRFDDLSGDFNNKTFRNTYGFIKEVKAEEKIEVKKMMESEVDLEKKRKIKHLLSRMEEDEVTERRKIRREEIERDLKKKEKEQIKKGKKPYFFHKGVVKAMEEKEFKEELEKSGKLDKVLKRKEKKMQMKEKKRKKWSTKNI